jgi:hypothetical protein
MYARLQDLAGHVAAEHRWHGTGTGIEVLGGTIPINSAQTLIFGSDDATTYAVSDIRVVSA